ncbi:conserved hypothetical protein [Desulforamulus reducens MI-1]|uniref:Glutamate decarboxylase n=1 Tax=Desulforamulus reducens (strain ATCC BAA-1160 / DSM 100696 / MI-1) TaxID=349161 RepID=A4J6X3_DESRM|nr:DUF2007 domain-containing protein [Desulforamulus reducens]ABO50826.1 conserved hypothetical protein [Desulforamulus reducens MI-1]
MWTVVYIAPNRKQAEKLQNALVNEGLLVKLRNIGLPNGNDNGSVEILVPESELDEALEIINTV